MPLYEFRCRKCSATFETLVGSSTRPACPTCGGKRLEKLISVFSAPTSSQASSEAAPAGCGRCQDQGGPGCPMR